MAPMSRYASRGGVPGAGMANYDRRRAKLTAEPVSSLNKKDLQ
jgi:hypothetical protein